MKRLAFCPDIIFSWAALWAVAALQLIAATGLTDELGWRQPQRLRPDRIFRNVVDSTIIHADYLPRNQQLLVATYEFAEPQPEAAGFIQEPLRTRLIVLDVSETHRIRRVSEIVLPAVVYRAALLDAQTALVTIHQPHEAEQHAGETEAGWVIARVDLATGQSEIVESQFNGFAVSPDRSEVALYKKAEHNENDQPTLCVRSLSPPYAQHHSWTMKELGGWCIRAVWNRDPHGLLCTTISERDFSLLEVIRPNFQELARSIDELAQREGKTPEEVVYDPRIWAQMAELHRLTDSTVTGHNTMWLLSAAKLPQSNEWHAQQLLAEDSTGFEGSFPWPIRYDSEQQTTSFYSSQGEFEGIATVDGQQQVGRVLDINLLGLPTRGWYVHSVGSYAQASPSGRYISLSVFKFDEAGDNVKMYQPLVQDLQQSALYELRPKVSRWLPHEVWEDAKIVWTSDHTLLLAFGRDLYRYRIDQP